MTTRAGANRLAARSNPTNVTITIQGLNAVTEHFLAIAFLTPKATEAVLSVSGSLLAHKAAEIHFPNWDTGDTWRSINAGVEGDPDRRPAIVFSNVDEQWVDVGPTTEYSRFLEWGFTHRTAGWRQFPFMMPAADWIEPIFVDAMLQVATIPDQLSNPVGPVASQALPSVLHSFRRFLYTYSRFAGDIQAVTGFRAPLRGRGLATARTLGDVEAAMRSSIGARIVHRAEGRFASGGIRARVSTSISGPPTAFTSSANRLYNRVVGQSVGRGFGKLDD